MPTGYELVVNIGADTSDVQKGLKKTKKGLDDLNKEVKKVGKGFRGTSTGMLGQIKKIRADFGAVSFAVTAVSASVIGLGVAMNATASNFKDLERIAKRLGVSSEELSKLAVVSKRSGIDVETLGDAMKDLNVKITDASTGAKAYEDVFRQLGLRSSDLVKLDPAEQFYAFADAIQKADDNTRRFALDEINDAMFQMIPLMEQGGEKIKEMAKQAGLMGESVNAKEAKAMRDYNKTVTEMGAAYDVMAKEVSESLLPVMTTLAELLISTMDGITAIVSASNEMQEAIRQMKESIEEENRALANGTKMMASGSLAMSGMAVEADGAATSIEELAKQTDALTNAGKAVAFSFESEGKPFEVPDLDAPSVPAPDDLNSMFEQELGGDNNGGVGGALARLIAEQDAKREAKLEHDAEMLNLDFEHMLALGEQKEAQRLEEEAKQSRFYDREFGGAKRHIDRLKRLEQTGFKGRMRMGVEFLDNIATATQGRSRKMFEITKAAKTGEALISTYSAVTKALDNPFPANIGFAASVAAAGAAQIAKIQSTSFGGGGGGGAAGAGVPSAPSASETGSGGGTENTTNFDVTLQGQSFSGEQIRGLIGAINSEVEDGAKLGAINVR